MSERQAGNDSSSFGYWVRRRRLALDLTQAALARKVACAAVTIKKIEHDQRRPSRQMAERLADALSVPDAKRDDFVAAGLGERAAFRMPLDRRPAVTTPPPPPKSAPAEKSVFVGREQELGTLRTHLDQVLDGQGRIVLVEGEGGRGKTALLWRFAQLAQETSDQLVVAHGYCTAVAGLGDPYLPFRDILLTLVGDLERRGQTGPLLPGQLERIWAAAPDAAGTIRRVAPSLVGTLVPAASLARWLGPNGGADDGDDIERDPLFEQLTTVLQMLARQRPLMLVIDDLQWADAASASLLFHLGRRLKGSRILIAGAFRPSEIEVAGDGEPGHTLRRAILEFERLYGAITLDLEQFDMDRGRRLSDALLDSEPNRLGEPFRVQLFWRTRGHPLFLVELLREMREGGQLVQDNDGSWVEGESIDWEAVPGRVSAVIEQRLSRLDADDRRLVEAAAVEGERFTAEPLAAVTGVDEVHRRLRALASRHGLVRALGSLQAGRRPLSQFQFSHVMFQRYLYDSLGWGERRVLHGRIAAAVERLHADQIEPVLATLAHHYCEAGDAEHAVTYLIRAGDRAHTLYAQKEAAEHYRRALEFLRGRDDPEATAHTLMKLGLTFQNAFDYDRAQRCFDEAFALWPQAASRGTPGFRPTEPRAPHPLRLIWNDPPTLDPTMGGYNLTAPVATQLFSGLVDFGPESEIVPDVAHRWEIRDGGRRYHFHLRNDVYWSDGEPVTAHDFAFSYHRALDPATATPVAGRLFHPVKGARAYNLGEHDDFDRVGIRALDDRTLEIELEAPTSYFIHNLAYYVSLPTPRHVVVAHGDDWATPDHIVTNGPFRLASWERNTAMVLERDPGFHGAATGNVERVHLTLGQPFEAQQAMYAAGELDIASNWFGQLEDIAALHRRFPDEYMHRRFFTTSYYWLDPARAPFADRQVRTALAQALDRSRLADVELQGYADAATGGMVPPGMPGHVVDIALPHDPDGARQQLASAGFPGGDGFPELRIVAGFSGRHVSAFLQRSWEATLGLHSEVKEVATYEEFQGLNDGGGAVVNVGGWWADYPDPDTFLRVNVETDLPTWGNDGYWNAIAQASRSTDQGERLGLYRRAEQILAEEAPLVPMVHIGLHHMVKPWVKRYPTIQVKYPGFWKDVIIEPH